MKLTWLALSLTLIGCGGSNRPSESPAKPPSTHHESAPGGDASSSTIDADQPEEPAMSQAPAGGATATGPSDPITLALADFENAWTALSGTSACPSACKALASMQRAAKRICELEEPDDELGHCRRAKKRLGNAETEVRGRCVCNGPAR